MLKRFSVSNYKIFKSEIVLDLSDVKDYDFSFNGVKDGLVNTGIIYGKNGSGKSVFGLALFDITLHLVDKVRINEQTRNYLPITSPSDSLASFSFTFVFDGKEVIYNYKKDKDASLVYEEVLVDGTKLLDIDYREHRININHPDYLVYKDLTIDGSIIRYIGENDKTNDKVIKKLVEFVSKMLWIRSLSSIETFVGFKSTPIDVATEILKSGHLKQFEEFLRYCELNYELVEIETLEGHSIGVKYGDKELNFLEVSSSGTKLLMLFFYWSLHFEEVSFMFLDEFNAFYHYSLSYKIASILRDLKCQTLMSTHDTSLMESDVLRPDCYFIMHEAHIASLPNLTKRELREVHNLERLYRNYGFNIQ